MARIAIDLLKLSFDEALNKLPCHAIFRSIYSSKYRETVKGQEQGSENNKGLL